MPCTITPPAPLGQRLNSCGGIPECKRVAGRRGIPQLLEPAQGRLFDDDFDEGHSSRRSNCESPSYGFLFIQYNNCVWSKCPSSYRRPHYLLQFSLQVRKPVQFSRFYN